MLVRVWLILLSSGPSAMLVEFMGLAIMVVAMAADLDYTSLVTRQKLSGG